MALDIIEMAKLKKAAVERQLQEARQEVERLDQESARWQRWIEDAESLTSSTTSEVAFPGPKKMPEPSTNGTHLGQVGLIEGSLAATAARLIMKNGPQTLNELLDAMRATGWGEDLKTPRANLSSALWRRLKDAFVKTKDGRYDLQTGNIVFLPPPSFK